MATTYEKLEAAVNNNEAEKFFQTDPKYVTIDRGMRGELFSIDYYGMAKATDEFIKNHPEKAGLIQEAILSVLRESKIGYIIAILEMAAFQLRYKSDRGFLSDVILAELRNQVNNNKGLFEEQERAHYQELDEITYNASGMHLM